MPLSGPVATLTLNPSADISVEVASWRAGEKMRAKVVRWDPGGGGVNVARVMRALGLDSLAIHTAGGPEGARLNHALDRAGLHHRSIAIESATRISVLVYDRASGSRYVLTFPGPVLSADECAACLAAVSASGAHRGVLIASGSLPPGAPLDFYAQAARLVAAGGGAFVLDTSGGALKPALSEQIYLAKLNRSELEDLAGTPLGDVAAVAAFGRDLLARHGIGSLAVTLGSDGALLLSESDTIHAPVPQVEVRSTVGAGDSFLAALIVALFEGMPRDRALRFAVSAGAAAVSGEGTSLVDPQRAADILAGFERLLGPAPEERDEQEANREAADRR